MGGHLQSLVDVTIFYDQERIGFVDLLMGRIHRIRVHIDERAIPPEMQTGDYENDANFRKHFQNWVGQVWLEKDERLARMRSDSAQPGSTPELSNQLQ
jgi:hypothetical protein